MIVNKVELKIRVFFPKKSKLLNLPQSFLYSVKERSAIPEITKRREKMKMSTALWKDWTQESFYKYFEYDRRLNWPIRLKTSQEFNTINWRDTTHFDSEDDYRTAGCRNVSHCQQQSYSRDYVHPDDQTQPTHYC